MSDSITSRRADDAPAAAREADRVATGPQAAAQRAPHVDPLAVAALLVAARPPERRGQLEARHQAVELRELVRLERVEAPAARAAPRRSPAPAAPRPRPDRRRRRRPGGDADDGRARIRLVPVAERGPVLGPSAGRRAARRRSARPRARSPRARPARRRPSGTPRRRPSPAPGRTRTRRGRSSTAGAA